MPDVFHQAYAWVALHVFPVALVTGLIASLVDIFFKRRNNVHRNPGFELLLGGTTATYVVILTTLGIAFAGGADLSPFQTNADHTAVAMFIGAIGLIWQYFRTNPYDPPVEKAAQNLLKLLGYYRSYIDGHCGQKTKRAIKAFLTDINENKYLDVELPDRFKRSLKNEHDITFSPGIMLLLCEAIIAAHHRNNGNVSTLGLGGQQDRPSHLSKNEQPR